MLLLELPLELLLMVVNGLDLLAVYQLMLTCKYAKAVVQSGSNQKERNYWKRYYRDKDEELDWLRAFFGFRRASSLDFIKWWKVWHVRTAIEDSIGEAAYVEYRTRIEFRPFLYTVDYHDTQLMLICNRKTGQLTLARYAYYIDSDKLLKLRPYLLVKTLEVPKDNEEAERSSKNSKETEQLPKNSREVECYSLFSKSDHYIVAQPSGNGHLDALSIQRKISYRIPPPFHLNTTCSDATTTTPSAWALGGRKLIVAFSTSSVWCLHKSTYNGQWGQHIYSTYNLHQRQWYPSGSIVSKLADGMILQANYSSITSVVADIDRDSHRLMVQLWQSTTEDVTTRCIYHKTLELPSEMDDSSISYVQLRKVNGSCFIVTVSTRCHLLVASIQVTKRTKATCQSVDGKLIRPSWQLLLRDSISTGEHLVSGDRFYIFGGRQKRYRSYDIATGNCIYDVSMHDRWSWSPHRHLFSRAYAAFVEQLSNSIPASEFHPYSYSVPYKYSAHLRHWLLVRHDETSNTLRIQSFLPSHVNT